MAINENELAELNELKSLKEYLETMWTSAKANDDLPEMYSALQELCIAGLITEKDVRLKGNYRKRFMENFGVEAVDELYVDMNAREKFEQLRAKAATKGIKRAGKGSTSNEPICNWQDAAIKARRDMGLVRHGVKTYLKTYEHVGLRREHGMDGDQIMGTVEFPVRIEEILMKHMLKKAVDERNELNKFIGEFIDINDEFLEAWEAGNVTVLEIKNMESSFTLKRVGLALVTWDYSYNIPVARVKAVLNVNQMLSLRVDIADASIAIRQALIEATSMYRGNEIESVVRFRNDVRKAIVYQKGIKEEDKNNLKRFKDRSKQAMIEAEAAEQQKEMNRQKRLEEAKQKKIEQEQRAAERKARIEAEAAEKLARKEKEAEKKAGRALTVEEKLANCDPALVAKIRAEMQANK